MTREETVNIIRKAGVVGAGGAGFPTHVKAGADADTVIANCAECEPLMEKDRSVMAQKTRDVLEGLKILMGSTGAKKGVIALKKKNNELISVLKGTIADTSVSIYPLDDYYPAGDEFSLVYQITGRLVPLYGIPPDVGVVVDNVETLLNVAYALKNIPVTRKYVTVAGAVRKPCTVIVPVGTSFSDVISLAGGTARGDFVVCDGGVMMGNVREDLKMPVTKTTGGMVILPRGHAAVVSKTRSRHSQSRIARSACDQCSYCTELCPRYLLGYPIKPHIVMRGLGFSSSGKIEPDAWAAFCCECSICSLYACPEGLNPKEICAEAKKGFKPNGQFREYEVGANPMLEHRRVPLKKLILHLGLKEYDKKAGFTDKIYEPESVTLPLKQHIGSAAKPLIGVGSRVKEGDIVADVGAGELGCPIHASIGGVVTAVEGSIVIKRQ